MKDCDLLTAVRDVYVLAAKPGSPNSGVEDFWGMSLGGLYRHDLQEAVTTLRKKRWSAGLSEAEKRKLKPTAVYDTLARALGAKDYEDWIGESGQAVRIAKWLTENGMHKPTDLIKWNRPPRLSVAFTAQQVADRLFNSTLPLPRKLFTGVGSKLFFPDGFGRQDLNWIADRFGLRSREDEDYLSFCLENENKVIAEAISFDGCPTKLLLTGRRTILNGLSESVGAMYTLLGDNLCMPMHSQVFRSYNMSEEELAFERALFDAFRREIEQAQDGWVDVLSMPGNENLIFLRGSDGTFDWVVRDQRDAPFAPNPLHPIFKFDEVPTAMLQPQLKAHMYFSRGKWAERIEHDAEVRHYAEGGTGGTWPGYEKLVLKELTAAYSYTRPRPPVGPVEGGFVPHRLRDSCLMVSPLVTIDDFWDFYEGSSWKKERHARAASRKLSIEDHLSPVNFLDGGRDPVSVTWLDAIAYCRDYERRTGLPVRLLEVSEWKEIAPHPTIDLSRRTTAPNGKAPVSDPIDRSSRRWSVVGGDDVTGFDSEHRYKPGGTLKFGPNLPWTRNANGLPFLAALDFGEWLADLGHTEAPAANAATGKALRGGPLERDCCPIWSTNKYKGLKTGFRLCYVASLDA